jgi:hypothetical protein
VGYLEFESNGPHIAGVACSFCGELVESGEVDPVMVTVTARADRPRRDGFGVQTNWCHAKCLEATGFSDLHVTTAEFWEDLPPED